MTASQQAVLYPKFYQDFSCIGPECEHHCCQNWLITIDRKTYKAYKKSKDLVLRDITENRMSRPRNQTDGHYRRIDLKEDGSCPLQNKDGSCYIHSNHGPKMLSRTCQTYPRIVTRLVDRMEPTLTLSCPEAARKVLLDPSAMMFDAGGVLSGNMPFTRVDEVPGQFDLIRQTAFQAVLGEKESPDERLFNLGILFQLIASRQQNNQDLAPVCQEFTRMQQSGQLRQLWQKLSPGVKGQAMILKKLVAENSFYRSNKVMNSYHKAFVEKLHNDFGADTEIDIPSLLTTRQPFLNALVKDCGHGLVNLMLHWLYSSNICRRTGEDLLHGYAEFVLKYLIFRFYLLMLAESDNHQELFIGVIHSIARSVDHNTAYLKVLREKIAETGWGSHSQIMSLLKPVTGE
ncbi:flagellin lysine-N-methylase [Endozoicomonadaceae bacterium StTr2]